MCCVKAQDLSETYPKTVVLHCTLNTWRVMSSYVGCQIRIRKGLTRLASRTKSNRMAFHRINVQVLQLGLNSKLHTCSVGR